MGFMRSIQVIWISTIFLMLSCGFLSGLHAQTLSTADPLTQAQIDNQRAQATYYQRQADKRGFWRNLREYGGPVGAAVAAIVAIISFSLNYRATLRSREDARFYEALNLFAEKSNPSVRSRAAALLEQMASTKRRYFETAFDQLSVGLLGERDEEARNTVRTAFGRLVMMDPTPALAKLEAINRALRDALAESFCRFCVVRGSMGVEQVLDENWEEAEKVTSYDRKALAALLQILPNDNLVAALNAAMTACRPMGQSDGGDYRARTRVELGESAERLRSNIKSISEVLLLLEGKGASGSSARVKTQRSFSFAFLVGGKFRDLQESKICRSILQEADFSAANLTRAEVLESDLSRANLGGAKLCQVKLSGTKLVGAILRQADLTGAKFENTDLSGADLTGTKFRSTVIAPAAFEHTEWWKADFRQQRDLLRAVHSKYKKKLPDLESLYVRDEIHQSVLDLIGKLTEERL
jgi:Pentapeptide repeats (8 copies)